MRLAFFSSSDFTLPILQNILARRGQSLWLVFTEQYDWLLGRQDKLSGMTLLPDWWGDGNLLQSLEQALKEQDLWATVISPLEVQLIVTQPNRENRGRTLKNPVAEFAEQNNLAVFQPQRINRQLEEFEHLVKDGGIDMALLASYGQILSDAVLGAPKYGFLNWHPSLLPHYRGATPMQTALANGDQITGLTWLNMTKEMDAGDIYLQLPVELTPQDDIRTLSATMGSLGASTWSLAIIAKLLDSATAKNEN